MSEHSAEKDAPHEFDEVQRVSYVGDSDAVQITCMHGDYSRFVKGGTVARGRKQLADHYAAKHPTPPDEPVCGRGSCGERAYCSEAGECLAATPLPPAKGDPS